MTIAMAGRPPELLILGASGRAAAFSALRAGVVPCVGDLFIDYDLDSFEAHPVANYARDLPRVARTHSGLPWLMTGGLENHLDVVRKICDSCPLLGSPIDSIRLARNPEHWGEVLSRQGIAVPEIARSVRDPGSWLLKSTRGAGGSHVRKAGRSGRGLVNPEEFYQREIAGDSASVVFLCNDQTTVLAGATRQFVGTAAWGARPFQYSGSIGPLPLSQPLAGQIRQLGDCLSRELGLRGLFGVDGIIESETFWPVEINPRYTASVEILELSKKRSCLKNLVQSGDLNHFNSSAAQPEGAWGKAILFARRNTVFPQPLAERLIAESFTPSNPWSLANYGDIPRPGTAIASGRPIVSVYARQADAPSCRAELQRMARELYDWLGQPSN